MIGAMMNSKIGIVFGIFGLLLVAGCAPADQQPSAPVVTTAAPTSPAPETEAAVGEVNTVSLPTPSPVPDTEREADTPVPVLGPPLVEGLTIALEPVMTGLDQPLFLTAAGDGAGRIFVVEKTGAIRIWQDGQLLPTPFLDLSSKVSGSSEQGLLGLAFSPDYADSGSFYVNYTDRTGDTVIARFQVSAGDPNQADPASEDVLLTLAQPAGNHNGGMLLFGPDGMLWVGTGDGGAANDRFGNGQNPNTLLGKMLRLDVVGAPAGTYDIPADNPWSEADWNGQDVLDEVWAIGLRNPWRFSFDRLTGDLWIGDVGQNQFEEVDFVAADSAGGLNFGWPIMEGNNCFQTSSCDAEGLVLPVADYSHAGHCSVTGGYVYRGPAYPELQGVYFFGDYCSGTIWALAPDGNGSWNVAEVLQSDVTLSSFGEDADGELYVTDLGRGTVYRLTPGSR